MAITPDCLQTHWFFAGNGEIYNLAARLQSRLHPRGIALEITLQHKGGAQFLAEARQHRVVVDQPAEDGAADHGMTPSELLLSALGSCIGQNVIQYLRLRKLPTDGLLIRVQAERTARPLRLADFRVEIVAPGLTERQLRALEKSLPTGLVHNALIRETPLCISVAAMHAGDVTP